MFNLQLYKEKFHFSVNFYSIFLLITFIPDIIGIDSTLIRLTYWGTKVLLSFWIFFKTPKLLFKFSRWENLLLIVYFIYAINIFIDVFVNPHPLVQGSKGQMDFIGFAVILIILLSFRYDPAYSSEQSFKFFTISLSVGLIIAYFLARENLELDTSHIRYDANSTINSIGYGQSGCALSLVSIFGLLTYKKKSLKVLFLIAFLIGLLSIAKAGSRSPVVVIALVMTFYLMAKKGSIQGVVLVFLGAALIFIFMDSILELLASMGSDLGARLTSMVVNKEGSGRTEIWENAINIISNYPAFGAYYIITSGPGMGLYAHNFILEIFMGTGCFGGIPFVLLIFFSLIKAYRLINNNHSSTWLLILYLQMLFFGMFSSSLFSSQDFWALAFYVISVPIYQKPIVYKRKKVEYSLET